MFKCLAYMNGEAVERPVTTNLADLCLPHAISLIQLPEYATFSANNAISPEDKVCNWQIAEVGFGMDIT